MARASAAAARASLAAALALLAALLCAAPHFVDAAGRLVEKPIAFPDALLRGAAPGAGLPVVDPPERVAGYFKLNRTHDAHMFYFFYESRSKRPDDPVLLWMTGGPGCSSEIAIFYENGPYSLTHNLTLEDNPYGWDVAANVIYVDQPINTGFSYSKDPRDTVSGEHQVAEDMLDFLQEFFEARPHLAKRRFFVSGESYAGHYAPAVANRVYRASELGEGPPINLAGVAIGNGLTQPAVQYGAYADYALSEGIITQPARDAIMWWYPLCRWGADVCSAHKWAWLCGLAQQYCQATIFGRILMSRPGINFYDIRKTCQGPLCYDFSDADAFLNSKAVRAALGVPPGAAWQECNMLVNAQFYGDFMRDFSLKLVPLLEDNVRVMIYAGDRDLICNWLGNRRWVDALQWAGAEGWAAAADAPWRLGGRQVGTVARYETLSFVRVFEAGHMVPMDQPAAALDMIRRFMQNKDLGAEDGVAAS